ncbi:hypothetical protein LSTR_LSTR016302 [Laodelphax striatellus]|uniref:Uncharacterized protein n=1 Tax=Laodelphax striatellus TaxID=195883 RepID=A0A482XM58_LAOST|nr:hypothetical protein LSTR_LSTR002743 [Laodelphax striatellus]RZF47006.1 hypothetical protein LSTR_LSTR016302 [Laodelphax striatellus]
MVDSGQSSGAAKQIRKARRWYFLPSAIVPKGTKLLYCSRAAHMSCMSSGGQSVPRCLSCIPTSRNTIDSIQIAKHT